MPSCLGIYIEENLIKYAKVIKEQSSYKIEAFGVKFYEDIQETINQIVEETNSYRNPISINVLEEVYTHFNMPTILSKKDLQKAIKSEFEYECSDKGINPTAFEIRNAIVNNINDKDKYKIINIAENKADIQKKMEDLKKFNIRYASPLSFSIANLIDIDKKENYLIVNIESKTVITTVYDNKIYDIETIPDGSQDFLEKINEYENSYSKSYEIVKNTTIYTSSTDSFEEEQLHLNNIIGTLSNIIAKLMKTLNTSLQPIQKIYITGTGALINNIELYFQEYLTSVDCQILKPYFSNSIMNANIKDYIEVNSAIALAMTALGDGVQGINFIKASVRSSLLKSSGKSKKTKKSSPIGESVTEYKSGIKSVNWNLGGKLDKIEKSLLRTSVGILVFIALFSAMSIFIASKTKIQKDETQQYISDVNTQIKKINEDAKSVEVKQAEYETLIKSLEEANSKINEKNLTRNAIPNLLNQIMVVIPREVELTKVENPSGSKVVIEAQSDKYEQLGFFIAELKTQVILNNVVSTSGAKNDSLVTIKIEGELP